MQPNGSLVLTTINRTGLSFFAAIAAAEYILKIVPPGTHSWAKFIRPEELAEGLSARGFAVVERAGFFYDPLRGVWSTIGDCSVNYGIVARKLP